MNIFISLTIEAIRSDEKLFLIFDLQQQADPKKQNIKWMLWTILFRWSATIFFLFLPWIVNLIGLICISRVQVILQSETIQEVAKISKELSVVQNEASELRKIVEIQKTEHVNILHAVLVVFIDFALCFRFSTFWSFKMFSTFWSLHWNLILDVEGS